MASALALGLGLVSVGSSIAIWLRHWGSATRRRGNAQMPRAPRAPPRAGSWPGGHLLPHPRPRASSAYPPSTYPRPRLCLAEGVAPPPAAARQLSQQDPEAGAGRGGPRGAGGEAGGRGGLAAGGAGASRARGGSLLGRGARGEGLGGARRRGWRRGTAREQWQGRWRGRRAQR